MSDPVKDLASAIRSAFRTMKMQAKADKERFGDWIPRLRGAIITPLTRLYSLALARNKAAVDKDTFTAVATERALFTARSICDTCSEWLQSGRSVKDVFSDDRVAAIALTEAAWAINTGKLTAMALRNRKVRWKLGGKACKNCKQLAGKEVKPGKAFGKDYRGNEVFAPPLHPNCKCTISEVKS